MANRYQRKVNQTVRGFNKSFQRDIDPYNRYVVRQVKADIDRQYHSQSMYLMEIYKDGVALASKWFDYYEVVGLRHGDVGRVFFWWINDMIIRTKGDAQ